MERRYIAFNSHTGTSIIAIPPLCLSAFILRPLFLCRLPQNGRTNTGRLIHLCSMFS